MLAKDSTQIRPLVLLFFAVVGTVVGILGWVFFISSNIAWVAQGMGAVDGRNGTQSLEAFEASYARGFRTFQIDLMLTLDDQVCAFTHWGPLEKELGVSRRLAQLDKKTFLSKRYYEKYTPLCLDGLTGLLKKYPDASFVVDVKDSRSTDAEQDKKRYLDAYKRVFQKLFREWSETREYWSRIIPVIHHESDLMFLKSFYRFSSVSYSLDRAKETEDAVVQVLAKYPEVTSIAVDRKRFSKTLASNVKALKRRLYVYAINDETEARAFAGKGASGFYTDTLEPKARYD